MRRSCLAAALIGLMPTIAHAQSAEAPSGAVVIDPHQHRALIYPPAEALLRKNGSADLSCAITPEGYAQSCTVQKATAPDFGIAAVEMAMTSHFLPAYQNQKPVAAVWTKTVNFTLPRSNSSTPILDRSHTHPPSYPLAAEMTNTAGRVEIRCRVSPAGIARDCTALTGPPLLQQSTIAYFTLARYFPALVDGTPVDAEFKGVLDWEMDNQNDGFR